MILCETVPIPNHRPNWAVTPHFSKLAEHSWTVITPSTAIGQFPKTNNQRSRSFRCPISLSKSLKTILSITYDLPARHLSFSSNVLMISSTAQLISNVTARKNRAFSAARARSLEALKRSSANPSSPLVGEAKARQRLDKTS